MPKPLIQPPDTQASGLLRLRLRCPQCAAAVRRQRRTWVQRLIGGAGASGHYVCAGPACAWTGLLGRRPHPATSGVGRSKVKIWSHFVANGKRLQNCVKSTSMRTGFVALRRVFQMK